MNLSEVLRSVISREDQKLLRVTPAMAAGVVTRLMDLSDMVAMLEESEKKAA